VVTDATKVVITDTKQDNIKKTTVKHLTVQIDYEDTDSDSYTDADSDSEINENVEVNAEVSDSCISLEIDDSDLFN
jgi:hypothetical protein